MKTFTLDELRTIKRQIETGSVTRSTLESLDLESLYDGLRMESCFDPQGNELHQGRGYGYGLASDIRSNCRSIAFEAISDLEHKISKDQKPKEEVRELDHSFFINRTFKKAGEE